MPAPNLVAHRGYALRYPENTRAAVAAAIEAGARYFEVDVQLTADGVPVLFHDRTLKRVCGVSGEIGSLPFSYLATLKAAERNRFGDQFAQEPIATLAAICQVLKDYPGVTGFIEVKKESIERFGVENVLDRVWEVLEPVKDQCVLISFSWDLLQLAHERGRHPMAIVIERWKELEKARHLHPEYIFCDVDRLPRKGGLHLDWTRLVVYEVADPARAMALFHRGVGFIETFAFHELQSALQATFQQQA
jgi:glycerophosphoryl diester phosphodiesterase